MDSNGLGFSRRTGGVGELSSNECSWHVEDEDRKTVRQGYQQGDTADVLLTDSLSSPSLIIAFPSVSYPAEEKE